MHISPDTQMMMNTKKRDCDITFGERKFFPYASESNGSRKLFVQVCTLLVCIVR